MTGRKRGSKNSVDGKVGFGANTIRLDAELIIRARAYAAWHRTDLSQVIEQALHFYFDQIEKINEGQ